MTTLSELTKAVSDKALQYLEDTEEEVTKFPASIVDFVIEYVSNGCNFPNHFDEKSIVSVLEKGKSTLAMACIDIYSKVGAEGQVNHSEPGVSRGYKSAWITFDLLSHFPNYVTILK